MDYLRNKFRDFLYFLETNLIQDNYGRYIFKVHYIIPENVSLKEMLVLHFY